jgi:predicted nucleic acid-binding protein
MSHPRRDLVLIAAHACTQGATIVTVNEREFHRIRRLEVEIRLA